MKKLLLTFLMVAVCLGLVQVSTGDDIGIFITASPKTLVFESEDDLVTVTVHTDVPFSSVDTGSVELDTDVGNPIPADSTYYDDRGNLVAKFYGVEYSDLDINENKQAEVTLLGDYKPVDGAVNTFSGSDTIYVVLKDVDAGGPKPGPGPGGPQS